MQLTSEQLGAVRNGEIVRFNEEGTDLAVVLADVFDRLEGLLYESWLSGDGDMDPLTADHTDVLVGQRLEAERQRRAEEERQIRLELEREHEAVRDRLDQTQLPPCDDA